MRRAIGIAALICGLFAATGATAALADAGASPVPIASGQPVPGAAPAASAATAGTVYFLEQPYGSGWCASDPAHLVNGKWVAGGVGTGLVMWGCQGQYWFGWEGDTIHYGTYANTGLFLIVNQANNLCVSNTGVGGASLVIANCNWNDPNQVWGENAEGGNNGELYSVGGGHYPIFANAHGYHTDGNPVVGWLAYNPPIPSDELWSGLKINA